MYILVRYIMQAKCDCFDSGLILFNNGPTIREMCKGELNPITYLRKAIALLLYPIYG